MIDEGENMDFSEALIACKSGKRIMREGWNGKGMWLELLRPDEHSKMTLPYIYINYPDNVFSTANARVPWLASQTDILAEDWAVIEP
jgi:hypothetical protein